MTGSLTLTHEGVSIRVDWPGGPMEVGQFARTLNLLERLWHEVTGASSRVLVPASALTYEPEREAAAGP